MSGGAYAVLGVSRGASKGAIRTAYLRLAKQLHPDVNKSADAPQHFQRLRDAYDVLSDDVRRREHDRVMDQQRPQSAPSSAGSSPGPQAQAPFGTKPPSYWQVYDRARRAQQAQRQAEEDYARRRANMGFDADLFHQNTYLTALRMLPLMAPALIVVLLFSMRHGRPRESRREMIIFDGSGRAFAQDVYGRMHRMADLDRQ
mmetsp:Transcript_21472/g.47636  ORF Transcript_21472/g.47636 Transcript_21472/m.47636 type:complete len:201 (+) Transcript_21472:94-696(+)